MISNFEYVKAFYYVAKTGSVTKAAGELSISQPAVSQAIKQLESGLGVRLIQRASRGIKLTREGSELFSYVEKGYEEMEKGFERVQKMQSLELGEIRIGASDMTLQFYLLPYLEKFHELYPQIKVVVTNAPTPETLDYLRKGRIDFGIISSPFQCGDDIKSVSVKEIEDVFVAGRRFISYKNRTLDFADLSDMPLIFLEGHTSTGNYMRDFLQRNGCDVRPEFELATSDMIVQFALRSLGVGCVMRDFAKGYIDSGQLFELRFNKMIPKRNICVVKAARQELPAAAAKIFEIMNI
ncbi:MAG: LysR family transcriptional regulator [Lachnospiraceae bacterium]|nr:LysR family transcriptional regulator [Lachnospiraceae bacterium]